MAMYAGLDVSDKTRHICVVNSNGAVLRRDEVASDPDVLAKWFGRHCTGLVQVLLETGPLSTFLYHGLKEREVPVDCICTRHAKGVKSDLEHIQAPTLIISAEDDLYHTLPGARFTAEHIPDAELKIFETGGHILISHGGDVREVIANFLSAHASDAAPRAAAKVSADLSKMTPSK